jgi:acylphosphatase
METIHIEVSGRVQGVGFRWFVARKARQLQLAGWVKNRPDGCVEVAAAGERPALELLEAAVVAGPPGAQVEHVQKLPAIATESLTTPFQILR